MCDQSDDSPLNCILPLFNDAHFALAPERSAELRDILTKYNVQINLDADTRQMRFEGVDLFGGLGLIYIGLRGLEHLWVHAYAITHVYRRFQATGFAEPLTLPSTEEGRRVEQLLDWALQGELRGNSSPWPSHLPQPQFQPVDDQHRVTNELFLGAAGFAVLHELGHIVRRHSGGVETPRDVFYRQEFEADEWAYDWVMEKWREYNSDHRIFVKRATLIAALFALMAIPQVFRPRQISISRHPNTIDRLTRFLLKHSNDQCGLPTGVIWAVAATAIHIHLSQVVSQPIPQSNSFRLYFASIRDALDRE